MLYRATDTTAPPRLLMAGAMTSAISKRSTVPRSKPGVASTGAELLVPRYSQNVHAGQFAQYGGGGEAWCSPTATEMVVEYWRKAPTADQLAWIDPALPDRSVAYAARGTFDKAYDGTGNWPFNVAYTTQFGLEGHVTRLRSMHELERYIKARIPVVTSQSFARSELSGAGYGTDGHLMVVIGFTRDGDVIANDPASPSDAAVRYVYARRQFERIWLRTTRRTAGGKAASGSGGIAYIIHPRGWPEPD